MGLSAVQTKKRRPKMTTETSEKDVVHSENQWETKDKCMDTEIEQNPQAPLNEKEEETKQITSNDESKLVTDVTNDIASVVEETDQKHVNTYRIRFKHGDSATRRDNSNRHSANVLDRADAGNLGCPENNPRKSKNTESVFEALQSSAEVNNQSHVTGSSQEEETAEVPESAKTVKEDTGQTTDDDSWSMNLPLLPEMKGNARTRSANTKAIRSLSTSRSSNWVLVGLNGKRHLRRPSPFPEETFPPISKTPSLTTALPSLPLTTSLPRMMNKLADRDDCGFSLPRIADDMLTKVNGWGFKTNPMTLSALLEVDHRKACLRDNQTVEFGKELGMLLRTQKEPQPENSEEESEETTEHDAKLVEKPIESDDPLEECHTPSALVVILTPVPPVNKENIELLSEEKEKTTRHHTTCSRDCGKKLRKKDDIEPNAEFQMTKKPSHETESFKPDKNTPTQQSNMPGCQSIKKSKQKKKSSLRKSRSTLPETLPDTSSFEKLPKLPDDVHYVFDDTKSKRRHDSKNIGNANKSSKSSNRHPGLNEQDEGAFNDVNDGNNDTVLKNIVSHRADKKTCTDLSSGERSESIMRERLADNMDFECSNDISCTFEDDSALQRAVLLRNRAFHPQTSSPPLTPTVDTDVNDCSYVFNKQSIQEWQGMDEEIEEYSELSRTSLMDKLRPALCDLEQLLGKNLKCAPGNFNVRHGEFPNSCTDIKQSKSVRFADLPPRRKREPSRSRSDPTYETSKTIAQGSAEWNECFLVAVGENRTIRKEVGQLHGRQIYRHQYSDFNDDIEDEIGPELIEREMKRYTHWLRHDRATEQHRWFSSNVSHRNFPISTHQVPSQQTTTPYGISGQTSNPSISAKIAKTIGLYSVLPKPEIEVPSRPVRFPKVPVLPPIAGGSNEVLFSKTFTGEVKGLPIGGRNTRNKRCSTENKRRRACRGGIK